jgi:predicted nucleic acid-binding protein
VNRYLLDTNIISNVTKPVASAALTAWMEKKRKELERWFYGPEGPRALFAGRVLPFDEKASLLWAELMAGGNFAGLKIVNPLRTASR